MDITKLRPVKISNIAREKVIVDFFPDILDSADIIETEQHNTKDATIHAGAFCLYATTLITKVHESAPLDLEPYYKERAEHLKLLIKATPKHAHLTDEQVNSFIQDIIIKDIRNSFAHGNFQISYDIYTKKVNFVLYPQRKDFISPYPIVISKTALLSANKKFINNNGINYAFCSEQTRSMVIDNSFNRVFSRFLLPTQMLKIADYYIGNKPPQKYDVLFDKNVYSVIQYALLASKITYEQDDYYNIFGRDSNIFDTISLIRNSIAHDNVQFVDNGQTIIYRDRDRTVSESLGISGTKLLIVDSQKQIIKNLLTTEHSPESIKDLSEKFKEMFNFFFFGEYSFEEILQVGQEIEKEIKERDFIE